MSRMSWPEPRSLRRNSVGAHGLRCFFNAILANGSSANFGRNSGPLAEAPKEDSGVVVRVGA